MPIRLGLSVLTLQELVGLRLKAAPSLGWQAVLASTTRTSIRSKYTRCHYPPDSHVSAHGILGPARRVLALRRTLVDLDWYII
jgi:hypothetical protein